MLAILKLVENTYFLINFNKLAKIKFILNYINPQYDNFL
jgi:hypothetical protein